MTLAELAGTLSAFTVVLTFLITMGGKVAKRHADTIVNTIVKDYLSELKPNGGGSIKDEIRQIKKDTAEVKKEMTEVKVEVARLDGKFTQHITESV